MSIFNNNIADINTIFEDIYAINDNTDTILCGGCIQIVEKVELLHSKFDDFTQKVTSAVTAQQHDITTLKTQITTLKTKLETQITTLETQNLRLNNKLQNNEATQQFMVIVGDIIQRLYNKVARYIKQQPQFKTFLDYDDFMTSLNDDEPIATGIYNSALEHFGVNPMDYDKLIKAKDTRNATFHSNIRTYDDIKNNITSLQNNMRIKTMPQNIQLLEILTKYIELFK